MFGLEGQKLHRNVLGIQNTSLVADQVANNPPGLSWSLQGLTIYFQTQFNKKPRIKTRGNYQNEC